MSWRSQGRVTDIPDILWYDTSDGFSGKTRRRLLFLQNRQLLRRGLCTGAGHARSSDDLGSVIVRRSKIPSDRHERGTTVVD